MCLCALVRVPSFRSFKLSCPTVQLFDCIEGCYSVHIIVVKVLFHTAFVIIQKIFVMLRDPGDHSNGS